MSSATSHVQGSIYYIIPLIDKVQKQVKLICSIRNQDISYFGGGEYGQ